MFVYIINTAVISSAPDNKYQYTHLLSPNTWSLFSLRGDFVGLRPAGELQLWSGGRCHGVAGHAACRRGKDPHSSQSNPLQHGRCYSLHLHGVCSSNHNRQISSYYVHVIFTEKQYWHCLLLLTKRVEYCQYKVSYWTVLLSLLLRSMVWVGFFVGLYPGLFGAPWWQQWLGLSMNSLWLKWASNPEEQWCWAVKKKKGGIWWDNDLFSHWKPHARRKGSRGAYREWASTSKILRRGTSGCLEKESENAVCACVFVVI